MRKWQLPAIIVALLALLYGMNTISQMQQEKAKKLAKAAEEARQSAELKAAAGTPKAEKKPGVAAFLLPKPLGPAGAPIKLEVFVDNSNACHETSLQLKDLPRIYGNKVRIEYLNMAEAKVTERSDKLSLGCDAGIAFNGKVELMVRTAVGKKLLAFRGPIGDKYRPDDVYAAVNTIMAGMGLKPPAAAVQKAKNSGLASGAGH